MDELFSADPGSAADDLNFEKKIFLGVNATCFVLYSTLAIVMRCKLRGVPLEQRTVNLILIYVFIFACKPHPNHVIS